MRCQTAAEREALPCLVRLVVDTRRQLDVSRAWAHHREAFVSEFIHPAKLSAPSYEC